MEIFNEILKINDIEIIIIYDKNNDIWFKLKDILKVLGYTFLLKHTNNININKNNIKKYSELKVSRYTTVPLNMQQLTKFINESGLYELLSISKKPIARIFQNKYFIEIMPEIRKNGKYILENKDKIKMEEINNKLKKENINLINNIRNVIYPIGKALYIITKIINNKKYYKIGYTKNLNNRLKVYNTCFPNKILFNYYLLVDDKNIDKCIKTIMKNEEFIKNK